VDHVPRDFGVVPVVHVYACAQFADFHLHGFHVAKAEGGGWRKSRGGGSAAGDAAERTGGVVHPSARVLLLTLISMVLVNYAHTNMLGLKNWRRTAEQAAQNYQKCMSVLERFRGDTEKLLGQ
jgi:hypothetical protein